MPCPECGGEQVPFRVPDDLRDLLAHESAAVAICRRCLTVAPVDDATDADRGAAADGAPTDPDLTRVSDAFPADAEGAVPLALAVGLLSSLAVNRDAVATLLERVERAGTDPLLAIDRLAADPDLESAVDLERRRTQLEQLL